MFYKMFVMFPTIQSEKTAIKKQCQIINLMIIKFINYLKLIKPIKFNEMIYYNLFK